MQDLLPTLELIGFLKRACQSLLISHTWMFSCYGIIWMRYVTDWGRTLKSIVSCKPAMLWKFRSVSVCTNLSLRAKCWIRWAGWVVLILITSPIHYQENKCMFPGVVELLLVDFSFLFLVRVLFEVSFLLL